MSSGNNRIEAYLVQGDDLAEYLQYIGSLVQHLVASVCTTQFSSLLVQLVAQRAPEVRLPQY